MHESTAESPPHAECVTLRALGEHHVGEVLEACADWQELARYGAPYWRPRSAAELHRKIAATAGPQPASEYTFVLDRAGALVGEVSLHAIDWRSRVAQVGVCIWRPENRGCGIGRQAVAQIVAWAWEQLDLARLEAWVLEGNEPSQRLFELAGFAHEATLRRRFMHGGRRHDMHVLGILNE